ncbi:MAG: response regulator [Acidobacteria bacterium]|nr:response regulator [Acidobacteriota bacterium]
MNSTKDLLHQILDPNISIDERALLRCRLAKQFEEVGNYEAARDAMGDLWSGIGADPKIDGLDQQVTAEVLLRTGTLTGWIGSTKQIESAQETAKNLLSQSIALFESLDDRKKVAEAQTEIAVCYKREGALDEARVLFAEALTRLDDGDADLKAVTLLRSAVLEQMANRLNDALHILTTAAPLFEPSSNHTLKGRFHNEFAVVLEDLGAIENRSDYVDRALIEYAAASFHFEQAGHARYQACVENNLGFLFGTIRKFVESHEHLDRAQALFTHLNDNVHLAQVEETRARVMLAEGAVAKAEKIAKSAVRMLEKGGEQSLLAEALTTHGIALARLGNQTQARAVFERAIAIAEQAGDLESAGLAALTLFEQLADQLSDDDICEILERAHELLKNTRNAATRNRLTESTYQALSLIHTFRPNWDTFSLEQTLHRHQARYIRMALQDAGGVISQAARLLGLRGHTNLLYMLKTHKNVRSIVARTTPAGPEAELDKAATRAPVEVETQKTGTIRILHVEDDPTVGELVQEMAQGEGWQLKQYVEGNAALEELASDADYDLLVVDYELPGVNGLELIRHVRSMFHRRYLPIVMMSGRLEEATAREAGADAFLRKPQDIGSLIETINRLLDPDAT